MHQFTMASAWEPKLISYFQRRGIITCMYKMIVYLLVAYARSATKQSDFFSVVGPTTYLPLDLRRITEAIDAGDNGLLGLLNLSASFDTVDHDFMAEGLSRTDGSARPRLIGIAPISVIANRRSS